ncbi:MAG TPA: hypothetical protein VG013_01490 [Gemmataceae bacterium]|jgi:hypothetical protein|nr:hypothetical protein [Gemmataceae bacterium]
MEISHRGRPLLLQTVCVAALLLSSCSNQSEQASLKASAEVAKRQTEAIKAKAVADEAKATLPKPKSQAEVDRERFIGRWKEQGTFVKHEFFRDGTVNSVGLLTNLTSKWSVLDDGRIKVEQENPLRGTAGVLGRDYTTLLWRYSFDSADQVTLTHQDNAALKTIYVRLR